MANHTVRVNSDLTCSPDPVPVHNDDTVTWVGDADFQILMPPGFTNPHVQQNGSSWKGTSQAFKSRAQQYSVKYSVSRGGRVHDPEVQVLP